MSGRALVVGVTGISGGNLAQRLLADGWEVAGLCRRPDGLDERITPLAADLEDADAVAAAVRGTAPTHVFFTTWSRRATEAENCDVNGRMLQNLLDATARREVRAPRRARHRAQALSRAVRGVRQGSAGHAVLRGAGPPAVRELLLRPGGHPLRRGRARRLHVVGAPAAHADRLGARERHEHGRDARRLRGDLPRDRPRLPLPGLARAVGGGHRRHRRAPARRPPRLGGDDAGRREPGPQHRQRRRLPLAAAVAAAGRRARGRARAVRRRRRRRSSSRWPTPARSGPRSCAVTACATSTSTRLASWWHTDADLGRTVETFTDMGHSRRLGFLGVRDSESSFTDLFARLRAERIVP